MKADTLRAITDAHRDTLTGYIKALEMLRGEDRIRAERLIEALRAARDEAGRHETPPAG